MGKTVAWGGYFVIREDGEVMEIMEKREIQNEQARRLRKRGIGYKRIAAITDLDREAVRYVCRDIEAGEDDGVADKMESGKACLFCGEPLPTTSGPGRHRRFCCEECRRFYWKLHRSQGKRKDIHIQACAFCGKTFEVYGKTRHKYCCHEHYLLHRNEYKVPEYKGKRRLDFLRHMKESLLAIAGNKSEHVTMRGG